MRRQLATLVAGITAVAAGSATALAVIPGETPFPSPTIADIFVAGYTVTGPTSSLGEGARTNFFPRGSTVVFKVFAAATKTGRILTDADVTYAYISIPGQPTLKLAYSAPAKANDPAWSATWTIPADYPTGLVKFTTRFKTRDKRYGHFVQIPVVTSQLTVTTA